MDMLSRGISAGVGGKHRMAARLTDWHSFFHFIMEIRFAVRWITESIVYTTCMKNVLLYPLEHFLALQSPFRDAFESQKHKHKHNIL